MPLLRAKDPQALFTTEARTSQINCVAARPPRLRGGTLSARVSNRFFTGGRAADERGSGRVTSYAIADGALCTTAAVDKPVQCLAVVETVKPAPALRPSGAASKGAQPKGALYGASRECAQEAEPGVVEQRPKVGGAALRAAL